MEWFQQYNNIPLQTIYSIKLGFIFHWTEIFAGRFILSRSGIFNNTTQIDQQGYAFLSHNIIAWSSFYAGGVTELSTRTGLLWH